MNPEADYGGSGSSGNGKLRQWLIEQVDCGKYPGLVWENDDKTIFRIPWKHAGKQDYNQFEDAALFKMPGYIPTPEWRDYFQEQASLPELPFAQCPYPPRSLPWQPQPMENGYQLKASFYSYSAADNQPSPFTLDTSMRSAETLSDVRLHVSVYFRDTLVREVTTSSPEGCHIAPCSPEDKPYLPPGGPELVPLPLEGLSAQRRAEECPPSPPSALERGVLLWMAPDGLYARRLCQGRVYWQGGPSPYGDKPNKLEREVTCKLLHTQDYLTEIQGYGLPGRPLPRFQVLLIFGDECLDPQRQRRTLYVQVEPLLARQLLYYGQQTGGHYYHSYERPGVTDHISPSEDYQRAITHHHSSNLQE
ncbi:interferon regulatory factor 4-like isoform X2 [Centroberyx affinis]|uniref:interferon regulatory factor 4-like isoform X2 n=1 Tax=Centroberyx affinis TaxID=166261 RepID=UPI003A5BBAA1